MMRLYSGATCPLSQRCRIVLFEKGMDFEIIDVDPLLRSPEILKMNPYGDLPILVERDLILYVSNVINEYIDARFPHPQLMPPDPVLCARVRLLLFTFEKEIFSHIPALEKGDARAKQEVAERLLAMSPIFSKNKYILGDDFSMLDVAMAPLLWRLDYYGVELGKEAAPIMKYSERIFSRNGFIEALTSQEKIMRK
ncbi:glutathione S-transferase N-terminal domain-containing protein [Candidatus Ichthyocystis hellenicum]|uniref:glutathione S-transferase N-terminal domain-containing protein n=1 Tax=Candidatus Ichthyocystis hellenicum TaxID=1561003 RepID=UPI000AF27139|nr:glutathione S-transferase N-terminal domain-containing protein [Candidatus Ichthyocystis hellenicum]